MYKSMNESTLILSTCEWLEFIIAITIIDNLFNIHSQIEHTMNLELHYFRVQLFLYHKRSRIRYYCNNTNNNANWTDDDKVPDERLVKEPQTGSYARRKMRAIHIRVVLYGPIR